MKTKQKQILLIEDDKFIHESLKEFLELEDFSVTSAFNGKEAEKIYRDLSPDVVFSDVMMPDYDGFYALEQIKKINPKSIVVMITGDVRSETINMLGQLGADAIIYKPFDMKVIIKTVNNLLAKIVCTTNTT